MIRKLLVATLSSITLTSVAHAISAEAPSIGDFWNSLSVSLPEDSPWEASGSASLGIAKGNADSLNYALQFLAKYEKDKTEGSISADYFYSENNGIPATNSFRLDGQVHRLVTDRLYLGTFVTFLTDDIADIDYRFDIGLAVGSYFIKNDKTKFSFEFGPGYTWEKQGGSEDDYASLRFSQQFEHQFNDKVRVWQSATFIPKITEFENMLITAEAGIEVNLNKSWSLRNTLRYQYDNTPAAGRERDDFLFLSGLSYALGGDGDATAQSVTLDGSEPEEIKEGWSTTAGLNLAFASGNADNLFLGATVNSAYRQQKHETFFELLYSYSEAAGNLAADSLRSNLQHNRFLGKRYFVGANLGYFRDDVADVSYRLTPGVTLGYYAIREDDMTLSFETGPSAIIEEIGGISDESFAFSAAQRFTWELNDKLTFIQSITALMDPSETSDYLLNANATLDVDLTKNLSWRLGVAFTRDNTPAAGRGKSDSTITTGIAVKF